MTEKYLLRKTGQDAAEVQWLLQAMRAESYKKFGPQNRKKPAMKLTTLEGRSLVGGLLGLDSTKASFLQIELIDEMSRCT